MDQVEKSSLNFLFMYSFTVNTCTISPFCHRSLVYFKSMHNCLNWCTKRKQRDHFDIVILSITYSLQCRSCPCAKCLSTCFTFISWPFAAMTYNISLPDLPRFPCTP